ncbi:MAG: Acetylserotonin O-methyltransferase [Acidobacteria bacterium]|nr:Acetylserotonin O-methyltransferase [Acidobacteriota bacterium]
MSSPDPASPQGILEIATAFQLSRALLTAFELDVFTVLNDQSLTSAEVASAVDADPRATDRLLNALVALGLLAKGGDRFTNRPPAAASLVRGKPGFMAGLAHTANLWRTWSGLTDAVREGRPPARPPVNDRGDDWLRSFIAAMHWRARDAAPEVVALAGLEPRSRVLDLGGGSGAFAMAFARAGHDAVVFDLSNVIPLTRAYASEEGLGERVETLAGDYLHDPIGEGYDAVLLSSVVHSHPPEENRRLLRKVAAALRPGGRIIVRDFLVDEDRSGPLQPVLFALNMLVGTAGGDTYTEREIAGWLREAGCRDVERRDTRAGAALVIGRL